MSTRLNAFIYVLSTVFGSLLSFAVLPLTTHILDAADYGRFAALTAIASALSGLAAAAPGYLLTSSYVPASCEGRREIVTSSIFIGVLLAVAGGALMGGAAALLVLFSGVADFTVTQVALTVFAIPSAAIWAVASDVFVLSCRSMAFCVVTMLQGIVQAAVTLATLYLWPLGGEALFVGACAGNITLMAICIWLLRKDLGFVLSRSHIKTLLRATVITSPANFLELIYPPLERWMLTGYGGLAMVGLYVHAQTYRNITYSTIKSAARSIWPTTLAEARDKHPTFVHTRRLWGCAQFVVTLVAIGFAAVGDYFLLYMTHGKFSGAYLLATAMLVIVVFQQAGRAEVGLLYARQCVKGLSTLTVVSSCCAIVCLIALMPFFGVWGALSAMATQILCYRIGLFALARRQGVVMSLEPWILFAPVLVAATVVTKLVLSPSFSQSVAILAVSTVVLMLLGWSNLLELFRVFSLKCPQSE